MTQQVLRLPDVQAITKLSRTTLYRLTANGDFPKPIALGQRAVGWRLSDVNEWIAARATKGAA